MVTNLKIITHRLVFVKRKKKKKQTNKENEKIGATREVVYIITNSISFN